MLNITTSCSEETRGIGKKIALQLSGGMLLGLSGKLGSGKTTLITGILSAFNIEFSGSPSFQLVHEYAGKGIRIFHIDCYRLKSFYELEEIAWRDLQSKDSLLLIEWYNRFSELNLRQHIHIEIVDESARLITLHGLQI